VSAAGFIALLPLLIVAAAAIVAMLAIAIRRNHGATALLSLLGLAGAFATLWRAAELAPYAAAPLFVIDRYALFYTGLILAASMVFVLLAYDYFEKFEGRHEEIYILMLVATLGSAVLVTSSHLLSLFLGLELLSVPLYAMIAYLQLRPFPLECVSSDRLHRGDFRHYASLLLRLTSPCDSFGFSCVQRDCICLDDWRQFACTFAKQH
jgi:NADH-quinone oxidoreductase subunit N